MSREVVSGMRQAPMLKRGSLTSSWNVVLDRSIIGYRLFIA